MKNLLINVAKACLPIGREFIKVIIIVAIAVPFISLFAAWTEPTAAPTGGNADAPINVGSSDQIKNYETDGLGNLIPGKSGGLGVGAFFSRFGTLLATDGGNVGIGLSDSPTEKLDAEGFVKGRTGLCIGDDCRMAWPFSEDGLPPGVKLVPANLNEDIYGSPLDTYRGRSDTCDGSLSRFSCNPSDNRNCNDVFTLSKLRYMGRNTLVPEIDYLERNVECKISLALGVDSWKAEKLIGTATIVNRDYSGSNEKCTVEFTSAVSNWTKRNLSAENWNDADCKKWVEQGIKFGGTWVNFDRPGYCRSFFDSRPECAGYKSGFFVPELKNIISVDWRLSGSSGPVEILYIP